MDVNRWRAAIDTMAPQDLTAMVLEESELHGNVAHGQIDRGRRAPQQPQRTDQRHFRFTTLGAFLEHVALVMENQERGDQPRVTLMTLHAAKGLEYRHVFLPGWEEGLFPSQRSMDESGCRDWKKNAVWPMSD
jgi:DNA helicase-2/ATP-dependent DNA helicase PcrA